MNEDDAPDIVVGARRVSAPERAHVAVHLNDGRGSFPTTRHALIDVDVFDLRVFALADFDGDADVDVVSAADGAGTLAVLRNDGKSTWRSPIRRVTPCTSSRTTKPQRCPSVRCCLPATRSSAWRCPIWTVSGAGRRRRVQGAHVGAVERCRGAVPGPRHDLVPDLFEPTLPQEFLPPPTKGQ